MRQQRQPQKSVAATRLNAIELTRTFAKPWKRGSMTSMIFLVVMATVVVSNIVGGIDLLKCRRLTIPHTNNP